MLFFLALSDRTPPKTHQPLGQQLNTFGRPTTNTSSVLDEISNIPIMPSTQTSQTPQPRHIPIRKDSHLSNGVGFNFRTINNDPSSSITPYSHIVTSVDTSNSINSQGLRINDYILSINDENVEYLNHEQLEDKLRRINNSETIRLLVTDGNVYRAYKQTQENIHPKPTNFPEPLKASQSRRQYRLQRNPDFEGYGFRVRPNQQLDGTPHQIVSVEPYSPADNQGLRVGDYILRVNNQTVEHMNSADFNYLMQNLVRNDTTRDGNLLLEVMDEETYRALNNFPTIITTPHDSMMTDRYTPTHVPFDPTPSDDQYPRMRLCFIRV